MCGCGAFSWPLAGHDRQVDVFSWAIDDQAVPEGRLEVPGDLDALRAAIALRAALPGADTPRPEFVAGLGRQLRGGVAPVAGPRTVSRRRVMAAGAVAAGVAGVGVAGAVVDRTLLSPSGSPRPAAGGELTPDSGSWVPIATEADVATGAVHRFATATVVGFVSEREGTLMAVSGVCTHLGCLLQPNGQAGRLDCPCHRTSFGSDGRLLSSQLRVEPADLPRIEVRRRGGNIEARLPIL
jgi:cytochrome b6-f complex iron-sulfur subunit